MYQYRIDDSTGYYDDGYRYVGAPVPARQARFVGVVTADVALVQLSALLASITRELGGAAFCSIPVAICWQLRRGTDLRANGPRDRARQGRGEPQRGHRAASQVIGQGSDARGRTIRTVDGETYLLDWWQYPLPDGPTITIANVLPAKRFDAPSRSLFANVVLFSTAVLLCSVILSIFVSRWVAKPLVELGDWATRLGHGNWDGRNAVPARLPRWSRYPAPAFPWPGASSTHRQSMGERSLFVPRSRRRPRRAGETLQYRRADRGGQPALL